MEEYQSALNVQEGIEQPVSVNPYFKRKKATRRALDVDDFVRGILSHDRVILSQAITLVESTNPEHFEKAQAVIEQCLPHSGNSVRVGITGVPGVGKSTFIESFGLHLTGLGHKVAVLAIDPSSERSKGSILGDKTRMEYLSADPNAFIRPTPSGLTLGGVARKTRETTILCEAAGFDVILIETVGVGQSETIVKSMVDFFLLLMLAGAGDDLQGIKRGIMEMADALVINKADGDNLGKATAAKAQYKSALKLFPPNANGWEPIADICSAINNDGIDNVWNIICQFVNLTKSNGCFLKQRDEQLVTTFHDWVDFTIKNNFYSNNAVKNKISELIQSVKDKKISPYQAGTQLIKSIYQK
ncbi:MAG: methylmalonyl Co-A mutase-associated GTPase MeaB [Bacteroidales bacterium]|nr:methylmalonyl Co-A mutase-associated GTPase MeaB [Bacteroidales bacterium]